MFLRTSIILLFLIAYSSLYAITKPVFNYSGQVGLRESVSAQTLGSTHLAFFLQMDFSSDNDQIDTVFEYDKDSDEIDTINPLLTQFSFKPAFSYGITDFLDVGVFFPINIDILRNFSPEGGVGDLEINAKIRVPLPAEKIIQFGLNTSLSFPTGQLSAGFSSRRSWNYEPVGIEDPNVTHKLIGTYSNGKPEYSFVSLFSLCLEKVLLHVNGGVRVTANSNVDELFILNAGVELPLADPLTMFCDFGSITKFSNIKDGFRINQDHMRLSPGVALRSSGGAMFLIAGDFNLSANKQRMYYDKDNLPRRISSRSIPRWGISVQTGWNGFLRKVQDSDGDLVPDKNDACPDSKEDVDGFEDADGCEDPDNDNDSVPDSTDKCRDVAEDIDGFDDLDGCPELDNDSDNVVDSIDNCPTEAEDIDGYNDLDGCADYDNDSDGVPDSLDKCLMIAEDVDGFDDQDGCPDIDNDMDGIPDSLDKCPDSEGKVDSNGCAASKQTIMEIKHGRVILNDVEFGSGSTILSNKSFEILDQLFASLDASPEIVLEIQAHTDNSGDESQNVRLSQDRAEQICEYLYGKGIRRGRLIPIGKGSSEPIADNETVIGRKQNTRIEIHRKD